MDDFRKCSDTDSSTEIHERSGSWHKMAGIYEIVEKFQLDSIGVNLEWKTVRIRLQRYYRFVISFIVTPAKAGVQALNNKTGFRPSPE